ncbi:hypothetical protein SLE2022_312290 [Rubroshorea leprosula]
MIVVTGNWLFNFTSHLDLGIGFGIRAELCTIWQGPQIARDRVYEGINNVKTDLMPLPRCFNNMIITRLFYDSPSVDASRC